MKSRAVIPVVGLCALLAAGVFMAWWGRAEEVPGPASRPVRREPAARVVPPGALPKFVNAPPSAEVLLPPMPTSFRDTQEDGDVTVDASGHLVPDPALRSLFSYYLSATGEESPALIRERILTALRAKRLPGAAMDEAVRVLDDYLSYLEAARSLASTRGEALEDVGARLEALHALRREHLGGAAEGLFGQEEAVDAVTVERLRLQKDASLTPAERERRMAALEERLPPDVRAAREESTRPLRQAAVEAELRAAGANAEDLHPHRLATVGPEATARLEALERERTEWDQRLADFRAKREALGRAEPDVARRRAAVQRLLFDSFSPEERLRVEAADTIDAANRGTGRR
jgi:lipase chaperone LimK